MTPETAQMLALLITLLIITIIIGAVISLISIHIKLLNSSWSELSDGLKALYILSWIIVVITIILFLFHKSKR